MRKRIFAVVMPALLSLALAGCQITQNSDQKVAARREWNGARSAVLASLANEQYKTGNFDQCSKTLNEALSLTPDSEPLHLLAAKLAIETGKLDKADQELKIARQYNRNDPETYYFSGVVYQRWQKPQLGMEFYQQAAAGAPAAVAYIMAQAE